MCLCARYQHKMLDKKCVFSFNLKQLGISSCMIFALMSDANIIPTNHTIYKLFIYGL